MIIADEPIEYPHIEQPDILVLMSAEAYHTYRRSLRPGGILLADRDLVPLQAEDRALAVPATRLAESLGRRIVANMVMLGALVAATGIVRKESLEEAVRTSVRAHTVALNLQAVEVGYRSVRE
ncbi:MAG: 2-oxoacid:acceptor oxidoreductase family protein [Armatimonadetes bacterium]|nr:2-oxoacid:acceptor oxidoreductase family protein [Armatimonadota bacterium]MDW8152706.1 2-oxoacid:acceptor oxidoreductase family protein [Armatimonadota bacterium]